MWCHFWEKHTDDRKQVDEWSVKKENKSQKSSYTETNLIKSIKVKEVGHKFDLEFPNSQSKDRNTICFKIYSVHRWKQARSQEKPTDKSFGDWEKFFPIGFAKAARLIILQSLPHQAGRGLRMVAQNVPHSQSSVQGGSDQGHLSFSGSRKEHIIESSLTFTFRLYPRAVSSSPPLSFLLPSPLAAP